MKLTIDIDRGTRTELEALTAVRQARRRAAGLPPVTRDEVAEVLFLTALIRELHDLGLPFADDPAPADFEETVNRLRLAA